MASGVAEVPVSALRPATGGLLFSPHQILRTPQSFRPGSRASRGSFEFGQSRSPNHLRGRNTVWSTVLFAELPTVPI